MRNLNHHQYFVDSHSRYTDDTANTRLAPKTSTKFPKGISENDNRSSVSFQPSSSFFDSGTLVNLTKSEWDLFVTTRSTVPRLVQKDPKHCLVSRQKPILPLVCILNLNSSAATRVRKGSSAQCHMTALLDTHVNGFGLNHDFYSGVS